MGRWALEFVALLTQSWAMLCMLRLLTQWGGLPFSHPLAQFCLHTTNWLVKPMRRIVPPLKQWDAASVAAAFVLGFILWFIALAAWQWTLSGSLKPNFMTQSVLLALLNIVTALAYVLLGLLAFRMLLSLKQRVTPLLPVLNRIIQPLCRPFSWLSFGKWDFSGSLAALMFWLWISQIAPLLQHKILFWGL